MHLANCAVVSVQRAEQLVSSASIQGVRLHAYHSFSTEQIHRTSTARSPTASTRETKSKLMGDAQTLVHSGVDHESGGIWPLLDTRRRRGASAHKLSEPVPRGSIQCRGPRIATLSIARSLGLLPVRAGRTPLAWQILSTLDESSMSELMVATRSALAQRGFERLTHNNEESSGHTHLSLRTPRQGARLLVEQRGSKRGRTRWSY